jgi:uncharacterized protein YndB with AHSA1/START domain
MPMKSEPVVKEIIVNVPLNKAWKVISDKDEMKNWYFNIAELKLEKGFEFKMYGGEPGERQYPISCRIVEVELGGKLSYTWNYDDFPAETLVTFELFKEGHNIKVRLTHTGLEKMPPESPEVSRENHVLGWNQIIGISLKEYLEK